MLPNRSTSFWNSGGRGAALALVLVAGSIACGGQVVDQRKAHNRVELAKDLLRQQQLEAAELEARKALDHNPENAEAHNLLGLVDLLRGLNNFRLLEIDDCLTGVDAEGLRRELDEFLLAADGHFATATDLSSGFAEAHSNRGAAALQLEDYERAAVLFEKALEVPHRLLDIGLTRAHLGWAYYKAGDEARAAKELRQALQFSPGMCVAKYRLGRVYFAREEWNKALEQFRAVASDSACPMQEAHLYLSKTYRQLGDADASAAAVSSCERLAPKSCIAAECRAGR